MDRSLTKFPPGGAHRRGALRLVLCLAVTAIVSPARAEPGWSDLAQLFTKRCVMCHAGEHAARGLRLDSYDGIIAGGKNGPVLVPRDIAGSELVRRLRGESKPRMPFLSYPLSPEEISLVERWIEAGSPP